MQSNRGLACSRHVVRYLPKVCAAVPTPTLQVRLLSAAAAKPGGTKFDEETDVLIVGTGAGALTAGLRGARLGLRSILIEKQQTLGGASAISGGGLWIPCNPVAKAHGIRDSEEAALRYFAQAVGDVGPASSLKRRKAFVRNGKKMVTFLQEEGFKFHYGKGYPDYYPAMDGAMGKGGGRAIESKAFNTKKLGAWESKLPPSGVPLALHTNEAAIFSRYASSFSAMAYVVRRAVPLVIRGLLGQKLTSMGRALVAQLLYLNLKYDPDIRVQTRLGELIQGPGGEVLGAEIRNSAGSKTVRAKVGVILAAGGFARNREMRERYMPSPASTEWTSSPAGDTGDAIQEGMRVGAATALLDDAWWGPTVVDPVRGMNQFALMERSRPHCFIVDSTGARFMNEAESYTDAGHDQYARNKQVKAIPAWLILDTDFRNKYTLAGLMPRQKPSHEALSTGRIFMADSLDELAAQIGVDAEGLRRTTDKFNNMCRTGVDTEFGRGTSVYDQFFGDPKVRPNPNLGPVAKAPFYAIKIWPGDLGTKGGLLTDELQRVLDKQMKPIPGLFALGNTAASVMGRTYLGPGSTLGPAMTHGYIIANHLASLRK